MNTFFRYAVFNGTYQQRVFNTLEEARIYALACQRLSREHAWPLGAHFMVRHQGEIVFDCWDYPVRKRSKDLAWSDR